MYTKFSFYEEYPFSLINRYVKIPFWGKAAVIAGKENSHTKYISVVHAVVVELDGNNGQKLFETDEIRMESSFER